jgi:transcriptional regulator with XRE-family HTH domain
MQSIRLRELRDKHKMTQQEVAEYLQLSSDAYSLYELGKRQMNYQTMCLLADYYNISVDYLLGRSDINLVPLTYDETKLVNQYRLLDKRGQESIKVNMSFEISHTNKNPKKAAT